MWCGAYTHMFAGVCSCVNQHYHSGTAVSTGQVRTCAWPWETRSSCPQPATIDNSTTDRLQFHYRREEHPMCVSLCACPTFLQSSAFDTTTSSSKYILICGHGIYFSLSTFPSSLLPNNAHTDGCPFIRGECLCAWVHYCESPQYNRVVKILIWKMRKKNIANRLQRWD